MFIFKNKNKKSSNNVSFIVVLSSCLENRPHMFVPRAGLCDLFQGRPQSSKNKLEADFLADLLF